MEIHMIFVTWLIVLLTNPATAGLQKMWELKRNELNRMSNGEKTMKAILELCFKSDRLSNPIIIFGDFNEGIEETSVLQMDRFANVDEIHEKYQLLTTGVSCVILIGVSPKKLRSDLSLLKKTRWWNHMIPFFIVNKKLRARASFKEILLTSWKNDIINSIYIHPESSDAMALYTLNMMANYAPYPWGRVEKLNLNVFRQVFNSSFSCQNLNYDKTKFLAGYKIRTVTRIDRLQSKYRSLGHEIMQSTCKALNTSCIPRVEASDKLLIQRLVSATSDLSIVQEPSELYPKMSFVPLYRKTQLIVVVKLNPEESTLSKILHLWSPPVLFLTGGIFVFLSIILIMRSHDFFSAVLDIIRLLTYVSIQGDDKGHAFRIVFTTILILMIISNGVFQGKIASFETKPDRIETVKTVNELIDLEYEFHSPAILKRYVTFNFPKRSWVHFEDSTEACINYVEWSKLNACIIARQEFENDFALSPVALIKEPFTDSFSSLYCRDNWPLHNRISGVVLRMLEAGLIQFWETEQSSYLMAKRRANEIDRTLPRYRPVKLIKLDFAFELLAIGLSLATITFFFELIVARNRIP